MENQRTESQEGTVRRPRGPAQEEATSTPMQQRSRERLMLWNQKLKSPNRRRDRVHWGLEPRTRHSCWWWSCHQSRELKRNILAFFSSVLPSRTSPPHWLNTRLSPFVIKAKQESREKWIREQAHNKFAQLIRVRLGHEGQKIQNNSGLFR